MLDELFDDVNPADLFVPEIHIPMITPAEEELIKILPSELKAINARIEHLERALSIQTLKLDVERVKRQKLRLIMKPHQCETSTLRPEVLQQSLETNLLYQNSINYQLGNDVDRLSTLVFRCLSRMQQLMAFVLPNITITSNDHPNVTCLVEEIGRTLQQLCAHPQTTTYIQ